MILNIFLGSIIQETAEKQGFGIIPAFAGHGIGTYFHGPPDIFHCGEYVFINSILNFSLKNETIHIDFNV